MVLPKVFTRKNGSTSEIDRYPSSFQRPEGASRTSPSWPVSLRVGKPEPQRGLGARERPPRHLDRVAIAERRPLHPVVAEDVGERLVVDASRPDPCHVGRQRLGERRQLGLHFPHLQVFLRVEVEVQRVSPLGIALQRVHRRPVDLVAAAGPRAGADHRCQRVGLVVHGGLGAGVRRRRVEHHRLPGVDVVVPEGGDGLEGNHDVADDRDLDGARQHLARRHPVLLVLQAVLEVGIHREDLVDEGVGALGPAHLLEVGVVVVAVHPELVADVAEGEARDLRAGGVEPERPCDQRRPRAGWHHLDRVEPHHGALGGRERDAVGQFVAVPLRAVGRERVQGGAGGEVVSEYADRVTEPAGNEPGPAEVAAEGDVLRTAGVPPAEDVEPDVVGRLPVHGALLLLDRIRGHARPLPASQRKRHPVAEPGGIVGDSGVVGGVAKLRAGNEGARSLGGEGRECVGRRVRRSGEQDRRGQEAEAHRLRPSRWSP